MVKVGISGFGRIGRSVMRGYFENGYEDKFDIVAVNATGSTEDFAHLFKYDSAFGRFDGEVEAYDGGIKINGKNIKFVDHRDPAEIPWEDLGVEVVIDSTGAFRDREGLQKHIDAGAKKVILSAPGTNVDNTIVMGVNDDTYDPETDHIISNASCTTNCLAPITKVINDEFGIESGIMTTIHAYTGDQNLVDNKHKDLRRARAAATNIVPTTTGAAKAVGLVLPEVEGKLTGFAVRVPVITGSLVDVVYNLEKEVTKEEVDSAMKEAAEGSMKGILGFTDEPIVSTDIIGENNTSVYDSDMTIVQGKTLNVVAWYDNEWGYSVRCLDMAKMVIDQL